MTGTLIPQLPEIRPGARAWFTLMGAEAKMVARDTAGLIVALGMPILILVMNGIGFDTDVVIPGTGGRTAFDLFVLPITLTFVVAMVGVVNMPSFLAAYRRTGILRRLGVTPASPVMVLVAQAVVGIAQIVVGLLLTLGVAFLAFGANPPVDGWVAVGVIALALVAMYGVGMLIAAVAPTPQSSVAIGLVAFFAMGALGGLFGPRENLPETLAEIGGVLPFGAAVDALGAAWAGDAVPVPALAGLVVTTVVSSALAALTFRWE